MKSILVGSLFLSLLALAPPPQQAPPPVKPPANYVHVSTLDMTGPQIVAMPLYGANPPVYTMVPGAEEWHGPFPLSTLAGPGDAMVEGFASVTFCAVQVVRGGPFGTVKSVGQQKEITLSASSPYGYAGAASDIHEQLNALGAQGFVPVPCN